MYIVIPGAIIKKLMHRGRAINPIDKFKWNSKNLKEDRERRNTEIENRGGK